MLYICGVSGDIFHLEDGYKTKDGYISLRGLYLFYNSRYNYLKEKKNRNFFLFLFPYLFPILIFLLGLVQEIFNIDILIDWVVLGLLVAPLILWGIGAKMFLSNRSLLQEIGDPERTVTEMSGTIDLDNGAINATAKSYDTYSGTQFVMMLINVFMFLLALVANIAIGWIYYIIYLVRRHKYAKHKNLVLQEYMSLPPENETMFWACEDEKEDGVDIYLVDENGDHIEDETEWITTFYSDNRIYTAFKGKDENEYLYLYEILPGYQPRLITSDDEIEKVEKIYNSIEQ